MDVGWTVLKRHLDAGDEIQNTVDYDDVVRVIEESLSNRHYNLLETLTIILEQTLISRFQLQNLKLSISKPGAIPASQGVSVLSRANHH